MMEDIIHLFNYLKIKKTNLLGHSMGGKLATLITLLRPNYVNKLIIADIAPRAYVSDHESVFEALLSAPIHEASGRGEIEQHLLSQLDDASLVGFLMKGLRRDSKNGFNWRPNIKVLREALSTIVGEVPLSRVSTDSGDGEQSTEPRAEGPCSDERSFSHCGIL